MKKAIVFLLIGMLLGAASCGSETTTETSSAEESTASAASSANTDEEASEEMASTSSVSVTGESTTESDDDFGEPLGPFQKDANIEETVLYDQSDVRITATGLTYENYSVNLGLKLENNSDKKLELTAQSMGYSCNAVNGFMIRDGYVRCELAPGESAEESMDFGYSELLIHGITEIASIQTGFDISDEEYNHIVTGPLEVKTPLAENYDYSGDAYRKTIQSKAVKYTYDLDLAYYAEDEVYSSGGIRMVSEAYLINTDGERMLMLEVENTSENTAYVRLGNIKANGTEIYDSTWTSMPITAGKRAIMSINLDDILDEEERKEYGISEIENIGFSVGVNNEDGMAMAEPADIVITL